MMPAPRTARSAFTLIEMLVVIAIIGVVSTMALTSISGVQRGTAMTTGASALLDYLTIARQTAMTLNQPIEVWFCPGATNDSLLLYKTENGALNAVEPELKLNQWVMLSPNAEWSSVLTEGFSGPQRPDPKRSNSCYSFRFMPDGSTDLAVSASPTLTLVFRTDSGSTSLPANFFTLQMDQQTGTIRTFRR